MRVLRGRVVGGTVVVEGEALPEGTAVTVLVPDNLDQAGTEKPKTPMQEWLRWVDRLKAGRDLEIELPPRELADVDR